MLMLWKKFKDEHPETNIDVLYYCTERICARERQMVIVYINEDGMILYGDNHERISPHPDAYWMPLPEEPWKE